MKANELMIGDWVKVIADDKLFPSKYVDEPIPCKVEGFSYGPIMQPSYTEKGIGIDLKPQIGLIVRVANNFGYMYFEAEKLSPVPLTDAILKANGFNREGGASYWHEGDRNACILHWSEDKEQLIIGSPCDDYMIKMNVRYVHELQHALRLCGINKEITL